MSSINRKQKLTTEEFLASFGPGLTLEVLQHVVAAGETARNSVHKHDPPGWGGQEAYRFRIRTARVGLVPFGWEAVNELGCAMVRNPAGDARIVIARGDDNTGQEDLPSTFYRKGRVLRQATEINRQLDLPFDGILEVEGSDDEVVTMETWVLLVYTSQTCDKESQVKRVHVRWELSMPIDWSNGRPTDWRRHKMPEFTLELQVAEDDVPTFDAEDDVDIELKKKE